jgi:hypothetical protein
LDTLNISSIFLLNVLKLSLVIFLYFKSKDNNNILFDLILYFSAINILLYGILVNILRLFSSSKIIKSYGVTTNELLAVEMLEFVASTIFLLLLFLFFHSKFWKKKNKLINIKSNVFPVLAIFNILSIISNFITDSNNDFLFGETIKYISGPSSILLTFFSLKYKNYKFLFISLINLLLIIFIVFSTGVRGPIIGIILIIIFLFITNYSLKNLIKKIPILVLPIILVIFFNNEYSKIKFAFTSEYISNPKAYQSVLDIGVFIIDFYKNGTSQLTEGSDSKVLDEIEFRLGARSMYSVGFLRFTERNNFVLAKPLINTLFVFFPRSIFNQNKPYPDSYDGEIYGMGMYVCANEIDGQVNMTDFYSSSHYYWQFGIFGVFIFTIISTFYIYILALLTLKLDIIFKLFFILVALKPYYFIPQFTISEIILMLFTKILPVLIFFKIIQFFQKLKFK